MHSPTYKALRVHGRYMGTHHYKDEDDSTIEMYWYDKQFWAISRRRSLGQQAELVLIGDDTPLPQEVRDMMKRTTDADGVPLDAMVTRRAFPSP